MRHGSFRGVLSIRVLAWAFGDASLKTSLGGTPLFSICVGDWAGERLNAGDKLWHLRFG